VIITRVTETSCQRSIILVPLLLVLLTIPLLALTRLNGIFAWVAAKGSLDKIKKYKKLEILT
jgi:hypothetical protein